MAFQKLCIFVGIVPSTIEGVENDGVYVVSYRLVFLELKRVTDFRVIFQTFDMSYISILIRRVFAS